MRAITILMALLSFHTPSAFARSTDKPAESQITLSVEGIDDLQAAVTFRQPVDVLAWSWGLNQTQSEHDGVTPAAAEKFQMQDLSLTRYVDASSPQLAKLLSTGAVLKKVVLKASNKAVTTLVLKDAVLTSLSTGGSSGEERFTENLTLSFSSVEISYADAKGKATSIVTIDKKK